MSENEALLVQAEIGLAGAGPPFLPNAVLMVGHKTSLVIDEARTICAFMAMNPPTLRPGESGHVTLSVWLYDKLPAERLKPGAKFKLFAGSAPYADGTVLAALAAKEETSA